MATEFTIVIVKKNGSLSESSIDEKKLKSKKIKIQHSFLLNEGIKINLYGKLEGAAGNENKYDFPPPIDNTLFFGDCILVKVIPNNENTPKSSNFKFENLTIAEWNSIYEFLFGGFKDLTAELDDKDGKKEDAIAKLEEMVLKSDSSNQFTKEGYLNDGFVVNDEPTVETPKAKKSKKPVSDKTPKPKSVVTKKAKEVKEAKEDNGNETATATVVTEPASAEPVTTAKPAKKPRVKRSKVAETEPVEPKQESFFSTENELTEEQYV